MYKNQYHYLCSFNIVFKFFPQVIRVLLGVQVWKIVNKFHPNLICLLINDIYTHFILLHRGFTIKIKTWKKYCVNI